MPSDAPTNSQGTGRLAGRVAIVTGVSDQGIGGAIAERLVQEGASVTLSGLVQPERLIKRLQRWGSRFLWTRCDVTETPHVRQMIDATMEQFGRLDVLVNNAGDEAAGDMAQFAEADWQRLLDINLAGTIRVSQAAIPHLKSRTGVIINVSSALSLGGCAGFAAYSAAKAGINGFTRSLAWELAPRRIRVLAVAPGLVHTPMIYKHRDRLTDEIWRQIELCHPLGMGTVQDVAPLIAFLATAEARWLTGVTIPLGWTEGFPLPIHPDS